MNIQHLGIYLTETKKKAIFKLLVQSFYNQSSRPIINDFTQKYIEKDKLKHPNISQTVKTKE